MTEANDKVVDDKGVSSDEGAAPVDSGKPAASTDVEVKIGDKTVKVAPEVAEALNAAKSAAEAAGATASEVKAQLEALQAQIKPAPKKEAKDGDALDVLLFTDPDKAVQIITQNILKQVEEQGAKKSAQDMFWTEFYKQNNDLKDYDEYVKFVFQREYSGMTGKKMTVEQSIAHLGKVAKEDLLKIKGTGGKGKPVAEGGSEGTSKGSSKSEDDSEGSPTSTASILAERAAARRAAKQPGRKAK